MPTLFFTDGNDSYAVTAAGDYSLVFLDGNDSLTVNGGTFTTGVMGEGEDVITLRSGDALIYGDGGNDRFEIYGGGFEARGGSDADLFNIRGGDHLTLRGDGGDDHFAFLAGSLGLTARGGSGNDLFDGGGHIISGNILGDSGNDTFLNFRNAGGVVPNLRGGLGDDVYRADATAPASFIENPGEGTDTVEISRGRNYTLPANIENLMVGAFAGSQAGLAILNGNGLANVVHGNTNPETINGLAGSDSLYGGGGADTLNGGDGNDRLDGEAGDDTMAGGAGNDIYHVDSAGDVITELSGQGNDLVLTTINLTLAPNVEDGTVDTANGIILTGNDHSNVLTGGAGNDHLIGGGGNDILRGGANWDVLIGGTGNDKYYVDDVNDAVSENPGEGTDTVFLDVSVPPPAPFTPPGPPPVFQLDPNVENLVITRFGQPDGFGHFMEGLVSGNSLNNVITDSSASRTISAGAGDDTINGNGGNDYLIGWEGTDTVNGGNGDDSIVGDGNGVTVFSGDTLTGGAGSDHFYYYTVDESAPFIFRSDQITDFETGSDTINLIVDADANTAGTQDWSIVDSPTGAAGQLWIDSSDSANGNYVVFGDNNGDGLSDLMIRVHAPNGFSASDIVI